MRAVAGSAAPARLHPYRYAMRGAGGAAVGRSIQRLDSASLACRLRSHAVPGRSYVHTVHFILSYSSTKLGLHARQGSLY